jgi:zinc protease
MTLVAVGDVDAPTLQSEVAKAFDGWSGGSAALRKAATVPLKAPPEVRVDIPGKTSVSVVIGQGSGLYYQQPDYLAMRLGTAILGSGFTGRLMANVRDKEGLTYGIDAGLDGDSFNSGEWAISASFAPDLLDKGIASTRRQLDKWHQDGVTASELASRKANLVGSFQVSLSTSSGLANAFLATLNRGYPLTWVDEYPDRIRAITQAQVNGVIQKYLQPQNMVLVKAGSLSDTKK